ncbi:hypothetical protein MAHJHV33_48340 [Mycobacterium avium subsp. hominissuis]
MGLRRHCVPLVSRSAQLSGLIYDTDCRASDLAAGQRGALSSQPRCPAARSLARQSVS